MQNFFSTYKHGHGILHIGNKEVYREIYVNSSYL